MLSKSLRLTTSDHKDLSKTTINMPLFSLRKIEPRDDIESNNKEINQKTRDRYAIVVSTKISKKSVNRNQIKRRFYSAVRDIIKTNKELNSNFIGSRFIFIVKKSTTQPYSFEEIHKEITEAFSSVYKI